MDTRILVRTSAAILLSAVAACSTTRQRTISKRTATDQLVQSEALDRAFGKIPWPVVRGQRAFVKATSITENQDLSYVERAAESRLSLLGARIVEKPDDADWTIMIVARSIGTEQSETFFGLPSVQSSLMPVATPEIALYKASTQLGFAKVEIVTTARGGGAIRGGPTVGESYSTDYKILFVGWHRDDVGAPR